MTAPILPCTLEVRESDTGHTIVGKFRYEVRAQNLAERFAVGSLEPTGSTALLLQHDGDRILASERAGSLSLRQASDGLEFTATVPRETDATSWQLDALRALRQGLLSALSPGFIATRERHVAGVREIQQARLVELSLTGNPEYPATEVDMRDQKVRILEYRL